MKLKTSVVGMLTLLLIAIPEGYAIAGPVSKSLSRELSVRLAGRQSINSIERNALVQQLKQLDQSMLIRLEARYGQQIPAEAIARARVSSTRFLEERAYQGHLKSTYPDISREEIRSVVGDTHTRSLRITVKSNQAALPRVVAHERAHQLSHPAFRRRLGADLDEGATDYMAARVSNEMHVPELAVGYPAERGLAGMLAARVGEAPLARAYFRGEFDQLARALDDDLGPGTFAALERHLQRRELDAARKLLMRDRP